MGRNGSQGSDKKGRKLASFCTSLPFSPNFATFFLFFLDSQQSQILSAFRHFPRGEMSDIKLLERLAPQTV